MGGQESGVRVVVGVGERRASGPRVDENVGVGGGGKEGEKHKYGLADT